MSSYLIIDGYNAINKIKELKLKRDISLEAARARFIEIMLNFVSQKKIFDKVVIVFDSSERELSVRTQSYGSVEAVFATHDKDADSVIITMLRHGLPKDKVSVCSDDNFVRNHARVFGREIIPVAQLEEIVLKREKFRGKINEKELEQSQIKDINDELKKKWGLR